MASLKAKTISIKIPAPVYNRMMGVLAETAAEVMRDEANLSWADEMDYPSEKELKAFMATNEARCIKCLEKAVQSYMNDMAEDADESFYPRDYTTFEWLWAKAEKESRSLGLETRKQEAEEETAMDTFRLLADQLGYDIVD